MFYFNYSSLTGNAILSITTNYDPNSTLDGKLLLSLKPGELIPENTNVSISIGNSSYEYLLKDLVNENSVEGNFYGEGFSLSGSGNGFGVAGTKDSDVDFVIKVTKMGGNSESNSGSSNLENSDETITNEPTITEGSSDDTTITEEVTTEENTEESSDDTTTEATPAETTTEEITTEEVTPEGSSDDTTITETTTTEETITEEVTPEESSDETTTEATLAETTTEEITKDNSNEKKNEKSEESPAEKNLDNGVEESSDSSEESSGGIAGITGTVVASLETEISGTVNKNEPYIYELEPGQKAEIVSSSQDVTFSQQGNIVTINTDYTEEIGFGEDYLGEDYTYDLEIDLSSLNLDVEEGELVVELNYDGEELISVSSILSIDNPQQTVVTKEIVPSEIELTKDLALNDEELLILKENTGKDEAEISKAVEVGDRLIIKFEIGEYWSESSYDVSLEETELNYQIEIERAKFLKRLANSLLKLEVETKDVEKYIGATNLYDFTKGTKINKNVDENSSVVVESNETGVNEEVVNVSEEFNSVTENLTENNTG